MIKTIKNKIFTNNTTKSYQIYQILRLVSLVLISFILVKTSFSRNETSAFELFLFIVNIGSFFWTMGINNAILSYFPKLQNTSKQYFFLNIFVLLQSIGVIVAAIVYLTSGFGLATKNPNIAPGTISLLSIYIFLYSPTLIVEAKYIVQKSFNRLLNYGIIVFFAQFLFVIVALFVFHSIYSIFVALVIWMFFRWIWTVVFVLNDLSTINISYKFIQGFVIFTLPIAAHILLGNGMEFVDGILIEKYFDSSLFSVYRYGAREFPVILIMIGALRSVMIPEAVENIELTASKIKKKTKRLIYIFFPIAILLIFISKYIFVFFYSKDYEYSALLFNIYLLIISSRIILSEVFIYAKHRNKTLMYVSFFELLFNIVLSVILMQFYGIAGIAFATFIAFLLSKIFLAFYTQKVLKVRLGDYLDLKVYLIFTTVLYLAFILEL